MAAAAATTQTAPIQIHYKYSALPNSKGIRLLKIHDRVVGDLPCCSLTVSQLDHQPQYIALSYTWGSPSTEATKCGVTADKCEQVLCNDAVVFVTRNLLDFFNAVRQCQRHLLETYLWTDAVCIDQSNPDERAVQVGLMQEIYAQAMSAVVWLGTEEQTTPLALEFMAVIQKSEVPPVDTFDMHGRQPLSNFLGPMASSDEHWESLRMMLLRTWFSRTWVLQEFCLARQCTMLCGPHEISIDTLAKAAGLILHMPTAQPSRFMGLPGSRMADIMKLKKGVNENSPGNLLNILLHASTSTATEPKDMVYGILGMMKRTTSERSPLQGMEISYRISTIQVFTTFTRLLLWEDPRLMVAGVYTPGLQSGARCALNLPSWVPNYTNESIMGHGTWAFRASNDASKSLPPSPQIVRRPDGLVVTGQKVGIIEKKVLIFDGNIDISWIARTVLDILTFLCAFEPTYFDGQPRCQALWLTLASESIDVDLRSADAASLEALHPIFGLWLGYKIWELARIHSGDTSDMRMTYTAYLQILLEHTRTLAMLMDSESDVFPKEQMLIELPKLQVPREILATVERFAGMVESPDNLIRPVLCRTQEGLLGQCTQSVQEGDEIWLIAGLRVPCVLRKVDGEDYYKKVDIAYVHGIMHGEFFDHHELRAEEIELI